MDDIIDLISDFFLELLVWEQMNDYFKKRIRNRTIRWIVVSLIYIMIVILLLLALYGICALVKAVL